MAVYQKNYNRSTVTLSDMSLLGLQGQPHEHTPALRCARNAPTEQYAHVDRCAQEPNNDRMDYIPSAPKKRTFSDLEKLTLKIKRASLKDRSSIRRRLFV